MRYDRVMVRRSLGRPVAASASGRRPPGTGCSRRTTSACASTSWMLRKSLVFLQRVGCQVRVFVNTLGSG